MSRKLRKELAEFEKQLGLLLVKVMKISDEVARIETGAAPKPESAREDLKARAPRLVEMTKAYS